METATPTEIAFDADGLTGPVDEPTSWLRWLEAAFESSPHRFRHVQVVWQRAASLRCLGLGWLDVERSRRLELAALLHDVGRALDPDDTEPHGFVGARFLDAVGLHDVAALVAHHSGAQLEAAERGMTHLDRWTDEDRDLQAVLTYLDRTTGPQGEQFSLAERRDELAERYGAASAQVRRFDATMPAAHHACRLLRTSAAGRGRRSTISGIRS